MQRLGFGSDEMEIPASHRLESSGRLDSEAGQDGYEAKISSCTPGQCPKNEDKCMSFFRYSGGICGYDSSLHWRIQDI